MVQVVEILLEGWTCFSCIFNVIVADDPVMQGARASAAMLFT